MILDIGRRPEARFAGGMYEFLSEQEVRGQDWPSNGGPGLSCMHMLLLHVLWQRGQGYGCHWQASSCACASSRVLPVPGTTRHQGRPVLHMWLCCTMKA